MNEVPNLLFSFDRTTLEAELGRAITPEEFGCVKDLNEIPPHWLDQLKKLSSTEAEYYLEYLWDSEPRDDTKLYIVTRFLDAVLWYGENPRTWWRGGIFLPSKNDPAKLFQSNIDQILASLEKRTDELWVTLPVLDNVGDDRYILHGAPCLVRPNETYRWHEQSMRKPRDVTCVGENDYSLVPIQDIAIATRRWLALQAADWIGFPRIQRNPAELLIAKVPEIRALSFDVRIALRALDAERMYLAEPTKKLPGFRGPDEWYAGFLPNSV